MNAAATLPPVPALVVGQVSHVRRTPVRHSLRHRSYQWLVDVDALPALPRWMRPLATFTARDHLDGGASGGGIRGDLAAFLPATNQMVWAILMTSLGVTVGMNTDLAGVTQALNAVSFRTFEFFALAAVIYYLIAKAVTLAARLAAARMFRY